MNIKVGTVALGLLMIAAAICTDLLGLVNLARLLAIRILIESFEGDECRERGGGGEIYREQAA